MKIWIFVLKFLLIGALFIISNHQLHLANPQERAQFFELYYNWISHIFDQGKLITGYVINSKWLPDKISGK
ncbi:hypothetical protein D6817_04285 [Candidatus Pacearchaeota archaeon]|nr:MAG: hypothetical protein D6817_04285 [Candidatus Pacearchaeota archaeon]